MRHVLLAALLLVQTQTPVASQYPRFHPQSTGPFSFDINQPSKSAFELIATKAGLNVVFLSTFQSQAVQLKLDNVDIYRALDAVSTGSKSFWQPFNSNSIFVAGDTSSSQRDFNLQRLQLIFAETPQQYQDMLAIVSPSLGLMSVSRLTGQNSILIKDSIAKVAMAKEKIAAATSQVAPPPNMSKAYETDVLGNVHVLDGSGRDINPARSRLQPKSTGPFSFDFINQPSRAAYETIAEKAGISIVFDRDWRPTPAMTTLKLNDVDVFDALDLLSLSLNTFWLPIGNQRIYVSDNNSTKHRDMDTLILEVVRMNGPKTPQELSDVMNAIRQTVNITSMTAFPRTNSLILKDTPAKVALVEKLIAELDARMTGSPQALKTVAYEIDSSGNVYVLDGSRKNINPATTRLQLTSTGTFSVDLNMPSRDAFETIAARAGLSVLFDRDYRPTPASTTMKMEDVDVYEALDLLSMLQKTFWQPIGNQRILISENNTTKHRDLDTLTLEVVRMSGPQNPQELNDVMNQIRQNLNMTTMTAFPKANALILRDTPAKVALAERLIADLDGFMTGSPPAIQTVAYETDSSGNVYVLDGSRKNINPARTQLQLTSTGTFSVNLNMPARDAFEAIAARGGLTVLFDRDYRPQPPVADLKLKDVDIYEALDMLSMSQHVFWQPIGNQKILISENNTTKHRDLDTVRLAVVDVPGTTTPQELNDVMNNVRQNLNIVSISAIPRTNSLLIKDTPAKVALAEHLIADLDRLSNASAAATKRPAPPVLEIEKENTGTLWSMDSSGVRRDITPIKPQLQTTSRRFTLHMNEDSRRAFEILGETSGLNVTFDSKFVSGTPSAIELVDVDIIQALALLSVQTGSAWSIVDGRTIAVTTPASTNQRVNEAQVVKSFQTTYATTPPDLSSLAAVLRNALNITEINSDPVTKSIAIRDTLTNIAIAEELIPVFDRPAPSK